MKELLNILRGLPVYMQLLLLPLILIGTWFFKNILTKSEVQNSIVLGIRKRLRMMSIKDLKYHPLFANVEFYKRKISNLQFNDDDKTYLFKTLLYNKLDISLILINNLIGELSSDSDSDNLRVLMFKVVNDIIDKYEKVTKDAYIKQYGEMAGKELFLYILYSPKGFNSYHDRNVSHIFDLIDVINESKIFDNPYERMYLYMHEINNALRYAVFDAEIVFKNFNGRINEIISKNKKND